MAKRRAAKKKAAPARKRAAKKAVPKKKKTVADQPKYHQPESELVTHHALVPNEYLMRDVQLHVSAMSQHAKQQIHHQPSYD